jgi:UPF0755 protein
MPLFSRKRRARHWALRALNLFLLTAVALMSLLAYLALPNRQRAHSFTVADGDNARTVAARLKDDGVIRSESLFLAVMKGDGTDRQLQPGTYDLTVAASLSAIGRLLTGGGRSQEELTLVVREGWTLRDIKDELKRLGLTQADGLLAVTGEPATASFAPASALLERYPFLKQRTAGTSLDGYLFPDTYRVFRDATPVSIVEKMLANFDRRLTGEAASAVAASGRPLADVVTMASLVENEVKTPADRRLVADIFWRRLALGMRLQADSTVNYALGTSLPSVSATELASESPYNTYRFSGLPPGPIGNPGLDAIIAAATPTPNDYLYFLTDAAGAVHYAKTYEQHLANKAKYLR